MMDKRLLVLIPYLFICTTDAANILALFTVAGKSHMSINARLTDALIERGHHITVVSSFPDMFNSPNYTHIDISNGVQMCVDSNSIDMVSSTVSLSDLVKFGYELVERNYHGTLKNPQVSKIVNSTKKYDVFLVEMSSEMCYLEIANIFDIPVVFITAPTRSFVVDMASGTTANPAYIPSITSGMVGDLTFWERLMNSWEFLQTYYYYYYSFHPMNQKICKQYFNKTFDYDVSWFHNRIALYLVYGHHLLLPRQVVPNYIEIGGMHIKPINRLPDKILNFIEHATDGVIYFSFGSLIKASSMSKDKLRVFINTFAKISQKVLWRCDRTDIPGLPDNVMVEKWFPQLDILAHPNVKAFISHGGLLSTYEAIHTATPVIGIPFWFDQHQDVNTLEKLGGAINLEYSEITEKKLLRTINDIIYDKKYSENMEKLSRIFNDRPMSALETAVYWTEYVINHDGAKHLRSQSAKLPMYQYLLLDVISFVVFVSLVSVYLVYQIFKKIVSLFTPMLPRGYSGIHE